MTRSLADLGERGIYRELLHPRYADVEAFGDDCALLEDDLVVTTDSCPTPLMEQVTGTPDPYHAGWLLATINLSDLAAAGAKPLGLVVNYMLPAATEVDYFQQLMQGVDDCARQHGTRVVGGDLRDGNERHLTATAIGRSRKRLSRRGARPGDVLLLVGDPGYLWAWAAVELGHAIDLPQHDREQLREHARKPKAQLEAGRVLAKHGLATAAVDVSDGLYASVRLLMEANELGAELKSKVPLDAVLHKVCELAGIEPFALAQTWGDWCLLVAVAPEAVETAKNKLRAKDIGVRKIGELVNTHTTLFVDRTEWVGMDQERFSDRSWQGTGIAEQIRALRQTPDRSAAAADEESGAWIYQNPWWGCSADGHSASSQP